MKLITYTKHFSFSSIGMEDGAFRVFARDGRGTLLGEVYTEDGGKTWTAQTSSRHLAEDGFRSRTAAAKWLRPTEVAA